MNEKERKEFLLSMYNQMWININRHILITWQPIALIITVIGLFALARNGIIEYSIIISIIMLICGWYIAHILDSSLWYNRNIVIISNIERQFLIDSDVKEIHCYFKKPHKDRKMINHFIIQAMLGIGIIGISFILYISELINNIQMVTKNSFNSFVNVLPFIVLIILAIILGWFYLNTNKKYIEFIKRSPGKI